MPTPSNCPSVCSWKPRVVARREVVARTGPERLRRRRRATCSSSVLAIDLAVVVALDRVDRLLVEAAVGVGDERVARERRAECPGGRRARCRATRATRDQDGEDRGSRYGGGGASADGHGTRRDRSAATKRQLEPDARRGSSRSGRPAVGEPGRRSAGPSRDSASRGGRGAVGVEARAGIEHLDAQPLGVVVDAQLDLAVLLHVLDGVGDQLGDQQPRVVQTLLGRPRPRAGRGRAVPGPPRSAAFGRTSEEVHARSPDMVPGFGAFRRAGTGAARGPSRAPTRRSPASSRIAISSGKSIVSGDGDQREVLGQRVDDRDLGHAEQQDRRARRRARRRSRPRARTASG